MDRYGAIARQSKGFSLIELVIVIVILGIIAVTAAPRFLSISSDATKASLKGIAGSVRTVIDLVEYKAIMQGKEHQYGVEVDVDGNKIFTYFGVPRAKWTAGSDHDGLMTIMTQDFKYLGNASGFSKDKVETTPCTDAEFCVIDQIRPGKVLPETDGWSLVIIPQGKTLQDKCFAYYSAKMDEATQQVLSKKIATQEDGC
ncbi:prepilin-type N-terminal cleavage/methylation domain-containing protein [Photobacterium leiognathi subsp. mandapamensis]|uniref:prepilin-type N-terminal cleavage/methylation domain-containing protein n=1 Tax=Photobacterium leiognathi TaxID=553611 RepID=UPI003BF47963